MIVRALLPNESRCDGCGDEKALWSMRPEAVTIVQELDHLLNATYYLCTLCLHAIEEALLEGAQRRAKFGAPHEVEGTGTAVLEPSERNLDVPGAP